MTTITAPRILYSPHTLERFSATKGDYFLASPEHKFTDSQGNNLWLVQTEYNSLGNLQIKRIIKKVVRVRDLIELDVNTIRRAEIKKQNRIKAQAEKRAETEIDEPERDECHD